MTTTAIATPWTKPMVALAAGQRSCWICEGWFATLPMSSGLGAQLSAADRLAVRQRFGPRAIGKVDGCWWLSERIAEIVLAEADRATLPPETVWAPPPAPVTSPALASSWMAERNAQRQERSMRASAAAFRIEHGRHATMPELVEYNCVRRGRLRPPTD